jgi:hypothetical protein
MGNDKLDHGAVKEPPLISYTSGEEAREATEAEHRMSLWEGINKYPTAVAWSMFFSLGTIM